MRKIASLLITNLLLGSLAALQAADLKLSSLFADHMVLQRDAVVRVWGSAAPGERVTLEFAGQKKTATADAGGKWRVNLDPMKASAEPRQLRVNDLVIQDVLVGEVWLCSGQSNMEWALGRSTGGPEALACSSNPLLRLCTIPHNGQTTPQDDVAAKWVISGHNSTRFFSAIAWWFGSKLQKELGVPVGIINDSYGGTSIQGWMSGESLAKGPWPAGGSSDLRGPGKLWNGMVVPLLPFRVRGVAWYQGESNAYPGVADPYGALLPALITEWRAGFAQPRLPFLIFQISAYRQPQTDPNEVSGMAQLREAQLKTVQSTPDTALVVTLDLGEPDVHYLNKEPAADRALKAALALAYGRHLEASGPIFKSLKVKGGQAILRFDHLGGGLIAKDGPLTGCVLAGADRKFVFADARIEGDRVVVSSPQVPKPVAVRYGWANLPKANLFSREGLPASPFRSDTWPLNPRKDH